MEKALKDMTADELEQVLEKKRQEEREAQNKRREAYEGLKKDLLSRVECRVREASDAVRGLFSFIVDETTAFRAIMADYGALRNLDQRGFSLDNGKFKIEVKHNKIKKFDERADVAAARLMEFLETWIKNKEQGGNDPMYQLAMTLLERNRYGDLDYKSISKLYELEARFDSEEYTEIMQLFKESNVVEDAAVNFYFFEKDELGVWRKLEPSFNRL